MWRGGKLERGIQKYHEKCVWYFKSGLTKTHIEMSGISCVHAKIPTQSEKEEALQVRRAPEQVLSYLTACKTSLLLKLQKL